MSDIPRPTDTGSAGTQESTPLRTESAELVNPFEGLPILRAVQGLAATRPRGMGGEVAAELIAASFAQISHELSDAKSELRETQTKLHEAQSSLSECRERSAVLTERVASLAGDKHLRNLCIAVGTALIGIGVDLIKGNLDEIGWGLVIVGVVLLLFGWISSPKGASK